MIRMAKQKPKSDRAIGRHKPRHMVGIPPRLYAAVAELARREKRPVIWQIRAILEDSLGKLGLWPPDESLPAGRS